MPERSRLVASDISVAYGGLVVVENVSVAVPAGRIVALVGPNGSGKTSLVNAIAGFVPARGAVALEHEGTRTELTGLSPQRRARLGLRRTFQTPQLFPTLSVLETVAAGCVRLRRHRHPAWWQAAGVRRARREFAGDLAAAREALGQVGLAHLAGAAPHRLALGQQRIVEVARAIASPGTTLLLDEPFAGLSGDEREVLAALLRRTVGDGSWGMLLVDHNIEVVEALADEVMVMDTGHCIASGPPRAVLDDPAVRRAYTGAI